MKTLVLFITILTSCTLNAQSFNDTIYYKSGEVRTVHIKKEGKNAISYSYVNSNGTILSGRQRKGLIVGYVIVDEDQSIIASYHNKNFQPSQHVDDSAARKGIGVIFGGLAVAGVVVIGGVVFIINTLAEVIY